MNEAELAERCGKGDNLARKQLYELSLIHISEPTRH